MSLASFFANKCFEYLLQVDNAHDGSSSQEEQDSERVNREIFPPWSDPARFKELCTGCGECVLTCQQQILVSGEDGIPRVDFSHGFCTFCGDCARSCPTEALSWSSDRPPWQLQLSISNDCLMEKKVLCQFCKEECEQEAVLFSQGGVATQKPQTLSEKCNGCGACVARCPVHAISLQYTNV